MNAVRSGPGYYESVLAKPETSLAKFTTGVSNKRALWPLPNLCHVCKWDGDMIATPFEQVRNTYISHRML